MFITFNNRMFYPESTSGSEEKIEPKTRLEHFLGRIGGNEKAQDLEPKTRMEHLLADIADTKCSGGSGVFFVPSHDEDDDDGNSIIVLEKTAAEIKAAMDSHNIVGVYVFGDNGDNVYSSFDIITEYFYSPGRYTFKTGTITLRAVEDNDYPREHIGGGGSD